MLQIQNIKKQYITGELTQTALDDVSLTLRDNEFVAILGPSGSGKTTLLNVIGGLDRYDSGDLIINGISTKKYTDRDWDSYRNHTIGFVFQSYNLIPHQTVLANVELALTISGISRAERKKRATQALTDVGLGEQLHKRPSQMSGGQMQRVAIARALVNNPDILLADEPTGALDSETSVQVMELLKEVSKDRLVVMVTHNPELAGMYANRIVRVKDGKIIDDTNPCETLTDHDHEKPVHKNMGRASMSFWTALSLSFNNLRTKKGRTILTAFAGSIGIIGIALIMSLSNGFQKYIDKIQEDTLSNYPLTIQSETADMSALMSAYGNMLSNDETLPTDVVQEQQMITQMFANVGTNDLSSFKVYLEDNWHEVSGDINVLKYGYGIQPLIYVADTTSRIQQVSPGTMMGQSSGMAMMSAYMGSDIFYEMIDNQQLLSEQYDVLQGQWPQSADEMVIVLSSPNQITDFMAYGLGLKDSAELTEMMQDVMAGETVSDPGEPMRWTYDDLMSLEFRLVPASGKYQYNTEYNVWEDMSDNTAYMQQLIGQGIPLKIVGIVCPKDGITSTLLSPGVAYTSGLTDIVIDTAAQAPIVLSQLSNPDVNVFTGKAFGVEEKTDINFENMISVDGEMLSSAFGVDVDSKVIQSMLKKRIASALKAMNVDTTAAQKDFTATFSQLATDMLNWYFSEYADPATGRATIRLDETYEIIGTYLKSDSAVKIMRPLVKKYSVTKSELTDIYQPLLYAMITSYVASEVVVPDLPSVPDIPTVPEVPDPTVTETLPPDSKTVVNDAAQSVDEDEIPAPTDHPESTDPELTPTEPTPPDVTDDIILTLYATFSLDDIPAITNQFMNLGLVEKCAESVGMLMMRDEIMDELEDELSAFIEDAMVYVGNSMTVDEEMIASAFTFNMSEEDLLRLMTSLSGSNKEVTYASNLLSLGYADRTKPTSISLYFVDFEAKSHFLAFLDQYNDTMQSDGHEDQVIQYTDVTNIMMASVRTIIDSVSYVLIAFVAVSLVVSSIMIGIITYISVMERTKEIGILRAIGASKGNISQVFNAETFIIGLCSGLIGVGMTLLLNIPINYIVQYLTGNPDIRAQLPIVSAVVLVILSMVLTLIGGFIPSRHAAKKDPVIALRSE